MTTKDYNKGVDEWADAAYRFARRCCPDGERCRDAVQDAFAVLWEHKEEIDREKGKPFLLSTIHNRLMSQLRHDQAGRKAALRQQPYPAVEPDLRFDTREAIEKALMTLPPIQRECLQLRDVEGYAYKEIAQILRLSDQQVQVYIFRARVAMKRQLKEFKI